MAAGEVHKNDIGTAFRVTVQDGDTVVDVSGATIKQIIFQKPSGTTVTQTATFVTDGTDGQIQYVTVSGDLDEAGKWIMQGYVVLAAWQGHSDMYQFEVYENLG